MKFQAAAETDWRAGEAVRMTMNLVRFYFDQAMNEGTLGELDATIRYVPIVMDDEARPHYPARSRLYRKKSIYDCAPQLDYETFVSGSVDQRLAEYLRGLEECAAILPKLGANEEQVAAFLALLGQRDGTLHRQASRLGRTLEGRGHERLRRTRARTNLA